MAECRHPFCDCECKGYCNADDIKEYTLAELATVNAVGDLTEVMNSGIDVRGNDG